MSLSAALKAARDGDDPAALQALLRAWSERPVSELAALVERVGARIDAVRLAVGGRTRAEQQQAWLERAEARDPADLGRLLEMLDEGTVPHRRVRLRVLDEFPRDPRIAAAMRVRLDGWGLNRTDRPEVIALLARQGDARTILWRKSRPLVWIRDLGGPRDAGALERHIDALGKQLGDEPSCDDPLLDEIAAALDAADAAAVARGPSTLDQLLGQIYAQPHDTTLRLVFADALAERGDPRGELITLQCERAAGGGNAASRRREAELLRTHGRHWLGELAHALKSGYVFERGFLDRVALRGDMGVGLDEYAGCPEWATVRLLDVSSQVWKQQHLAQMLAEGRLPSLRELLGVRPTLLEALAEGPLAVRAAANNRVELIRFNCEDTHYGGWSRGAELVSRCEGFPALLELVLTGATELSLSLPLWLAGAEVVGRLAGFGAHTHLRATGKLLDALEARPDTGIGELVVFDTPWRLGLHRRPDRRWDAVARIASGVRRRAGWIELLIGGLDSLRPASIATLDVRLPRTRRDPNFASLVAPSVERLWLDEVRLG